MTNLSADRCWRRKPAFRSLRQVTFFGDQNKRSKFVDLNIHHIPLSGKVRTSGKGLAKLTP
ncbi:hypothetical protein MARINON1_60004 [Marinobacter salarius]|nr:hypothetical protein MARINON1_60004 [Marinobacter salarius]